MRVGNAASTQTQLDVYGEVLDTLALACRAGIAATDHQREVERRVVEHLERIWPDRDAGIWESRGKPKKVHILQGDVLGRLRPRSAAL